jgi:hypothetical protein
MVCVTSRKKKVWARHVGECPAGCREGPPIGWVLSKPKRLPLTPMKGQLGLFNPTQSVLKKLGLPEALSLRFLEHKMGRVFRSLAFGYGKPQRMKVQTIEQQFTLTEKNGYRRDVERVD